MGRKAVVVLAEGFEEIEAVTQIDVLRRGGIEVTVAGLGSDTIAGSHGLAIKTDCTIDEIGFTPDAIVLPGGMPGAKNLGESDAVQKLALAVAEAGGICAAICAAPALTFTKWGLLNGKTATCYPSFEKEFTAGATHSEERVVVDGNVVTSRAPGTALEFGLKLVELLSGPEAAAQLRRGMLVK